MIDFLNNLLKLNLETGPYITGSYMTYIVECKYRTPSWKPRDIDLVCRTQSQIDSVDKILKKLDPKRIIFRSGKIAYYQWNINDHQIQGILYDLSAKDWVDTADFTIIAITSDGVNTIQDNDTENDIISKILKRKPHHTFGLRSFNLSRYQKYLNRGFQDIDNKIFNEISQCPLYKIT